MFSWRRPGLFVVSSARSGTSLSGWHLLPTHRWKGCAVVLISCESMVTFMSFIVSDAMMISISDDLRWRSSWSPDFGTLTSSFFQSQLDEALMIFHDFPMAISMGPGRSVLLAPISGMSDTRTRRCRRAGRWKPIRFFHSDCLIAWLWPSNG